MTIEATDLKGGNSVTMGKIGANVSLFFGGRRRGIWSVTLSLCSVLSRGRREGVIHGRLRFSKPERIGSSYCGFPHPVPDTQVIVCHFAVHRYMHEPKE